MRLRLNLYRGIGADKLSAEKHSRYVLAPVNPSALAIIKFAQPLAMALRDLKREAPSAGIVVLTIALPERI
jgi:hypothetical protein